MQDLQEKTISFAPYYPRRRGGVLLGDMVGLGKTLVATAITCVFQKDDQSKTLVICPPELAPMWDGYLQKYEVHGRVWSFGKIAETFECPMRRTTAWEHEIDERVSRLYTLTKDEITLIEEAR